MVMMAAKVRLSSISPYSQSRFHNVPKLEKEAPDDYEARTWAERQHRNQDGHVFLPPMSLKNCISEAAQYLSIKIPGKGQATYTKHFDAGILVLNPSVLYNPKTGEPIHAESVRGDWIFTPSDGKRGGGSRVMKCYPLIDEWTAEAEFLVLDNTITEPVFSYHLQQAGSLIGLGRFRVRNRGYYGRFIIDELKWEKVE